MNYKFFIVIALFAYLNSPAQKKVQQGESQSLITQEQFNKIQEIVQPVKDKVETLLNKDKSGMYQAYLKDIKKLKENTENAARVAISNKIKKKYDAFLNAIWASAEIEEQIYQQQIGEVLYLSVGKKISWYPFLNCVIIVSVPASSPPSDPPPPNKCINVCDIVAGEIRANGGLISSGNGSYGNCFIKINAWAGAAGITEAYGSLKNNVTIPGTFPDDKRKIRVKQGFELSQETGSFAALGFAYGQTDIQTKNSHEYLLCISPVVGVLSKVVRKTIIEEYVLEKKDIAQSVIKTWASSFAFNVISGGWGWSECNSIRWTMCEE